MADEKHYSDYENLENILTNIVQGMVDKINTNIVNSSPPYVSKFRDGLLKKEDYINLQKLLKYPQIFIPYDANDGDLLIYNKNDNRLETFNMNDYKILTKNEYNKIIERLEILENNL